MHELKFGAWALEINQGFKGYTDKDFILQWTSCC